MTSAGFVVGQTTSNPVIASLGTTLGKGTLTSIVLVMLILPQLLYMFDGIIAKTYYKSKLSLENLSKLRAEAAGEEKDNEMDASRRSPSSDRRYVIYTVRNCIAGRGDRLCDYYRISRGSGPVGRQW